MFAWRKITLVSFHDFKEEWERENTNFDLPNLKLIRETLFGAVFN